MSQIKQLQPRPDVILLAVMVPEGAYSFDVEHNPLLKNEQLFFRDEFMGLPNVTRCRDLPEGNWKLLGIATEITESVWQTLLIKGGNEAFGDLYKGSELYHTDAKQAAMSLLEANQCFSVNPYEKPDIQYYMSDSAFTTRNYHEKLEQWQQAEANTGTWLILKEI